jgi:Na+/H+ antiporter NhaD/arsenite permease-like protein
MSFLHKRGYHSGFWEFVRIGLPFTLFAVVAGALFAWFLWQ